jgi:hypothetical protein
MLYTAVMSDNRKRVRLWIRRQQRYYRQSPVLDPEDVARLLENQQEKLSMSMPELVLRYGALVAFQIVRFSNV